ncbi:MAG: hypothetical protein ABIS36_22660 [Chryseolinea sp.]
MGAVIFLTLQGSAFQHSLQHVTHSDKEINGFVFQIDEVRIFKNNSYWQASYAALSIGKMIFNPLSFALINQHWHHGKQPLLE